MYEIIVMTYEDNNLLFRERRRCSMDEDILQYSSDSDTIKINLRDFCFCKENAESILNINYNRCELTLKELNQRMEIPLDYINFKNDNNKTLEIEYKLISQDKPLKIILEIEGEINDV